MFFKIKYLALLMVFLLICTGFIDYPPKQIVDHHFKSLNDHNVEQLAKDYNESAPILSVSWEGVKTGPPQIKSAYERYFHTSPDLVYKITKIIYGEQSAVIEYESTGTMTNPEAGTPAYMTGKKYTLKNCTVMQFKNGKIIYESTYFDQVAFLRQVGFFDQK